MLVSAAGAGDVGGVRAAMAAGAEMDGRDGRGRLALTEAVRRGHLLVVEYLMDRGADAAAASFKGSGVWDAEGPLMLAVIAKNEAMVRALLRYGAPQPTREERAWTPLHEAAKTGNLSILRLLLGAGGAPDLPDERAETALHVALREGFDEGAAALLNAGANPNLPNRDGELPIRRAACAFDAKTARLLLARGADPNQAPPRGALDHVTPWDAFCSLVLAMMSPAERRRLRPGDPTRREVYAMLRLLLQAGADKDRVCPIGGNRAPWSERLAALGDNRLNEILGHTQPESRRQRLATHRI